MSAHTLTEYGTTDCPVERVRACADPDGDGLVCSACGGEVLTSYAKPLANPKRIGLTVGMSPVTDTPTHAPYVHPALVAVRQTPEHQSLAAESAHAAAQVYGGDAWFQRMRNADAAIERLEREAIDVWDGTDTLPTPNPIHCASCEVVHDADDLTMPCRADYDPTDAELREAGLL